MLQEENCKEVGSSSSSSSSSPPPFPFPPYPQQSDLMSTLIECMTSSSVGIFESPTGTGKSLSVICSTMHWLRQEQQAILAATRLDVEKDTTSSISGGGEDRKGKADDWLLDLMQKPGDKERRREVEKKSKALERFHDLLEQVEQAKSRKRFAEYGQRDFRKAFVPVHSQRHDAIEKEDDRDAEGDEAFELEEYLSDDERKMRAAGADTIESEGDTDGDDDGDNDTHGVWGLKMPQILYCSRTHSQISQFVREIQRTAFGDARCITLGSRKNFCINPEVNSLGSDMAISETCLEMQRSKSKSKPIEPITGSTSAGRKRRRSSKEVKGPCSYKGRSKEAAFSMSALGSIRDIEELVVLGQEMNSCPYYASRRAIRGAEIVCMPYNMLLAEDLRTAMGVRLEGNVVVFDEAHNLVDAVNHTYSVNMNLMEIKTAAKAVQTYFARYRPRLAGKNVYYLNLVLAVLSGIQNALVKAFKKPLGGKDVNPTVAQTASYQTESPPDMQLMTPNDFIFAARLDNINLLKVRRFVQNSNLVNKIGGLLESQARQNAAAEAAMLNHPDNPGVEKDGKKSLWNESTRALRVLLSLLSCLMNTDKDGRVVVCRGEKDPDSDTYPYMEVKFILLDPSSHFKKIVETARSVILLGGTMQPFSYVQSFLFPWLPTARLRLFSCGHVVSSKNVAAMALSIGTDSVEFDFRHSSRLSRPVVQSLKNTLREVCTVVPNGVVVFMTSYSYMDSLLKSWAAAAVEAGASSRSPIVDVLARELRRPVFIEPTNAVDSERVLGAYSVCAESIKGAVLFCVMGGKMSEGINFSDALARCVIVVGMPFADRRDPILQEKLKHADSLNANSGNALYEAMCMKTVNQTIGRSIRHANDYAAILLLDKRYAQRSVIGQLPGWISKSMEVGLTLSQAKEELNKFFQARNT